MSYIVHYGVKGMKKGTRRWTNSDGSLNEAGKARYKNRVAANIVSNLGSSNEKTKLIQRESSPNPTNGTRVANLRGKWQDVKDAEKKKEEAKREAVSKVEDQYNKMRQRTQSAVATGVNLTSAIKDSHRGARQPNSQRKKKTAREKGKAFISNLLKK